MKDINELGIEEQLSRGATRRTVVTTGAKLAYAAPLVAASLRLTASGALAACGGATPIEITVDGELRCCGCCTQSLTTRQMKAAKAQALADDQFDICQAALKSQGTDCPQAGEPGSNVKRVCVAQNANPISPPA